MTDIDQDDVARIERGDFMLLERRLAALRTLRLARGSGDHRFVATVCQRLPEELTGDDIYQVACMVWRFRRALPRGVAPRINPADPLSADYLAVRMGCSPTLAAIRTERAA